MATRNGDNGDNLIRGTIFDDTLNGFGGNDDLRGRNGDDTLNGGSGNDILDGEDGDDRLNGDANDDSLSGGDGNDNLSGAGGKDGISGGLGNDRISGGDENDSLNGNAGNDTVDGGDGNDLVQGQEGADDLDGGDGGDRALYNLSDAGVTVDLEQGEGSGADAEGDTLTDIENIEGSDFSDTLLGDGGSNVLIGRVGDDVLRGRGGDDTLFGRDDADTLDGGTGEDTALYSSSGAAVVIKLFDGTASGGDADGDELIDIENLLGSDFDDSLTGDGKSNRLTGIDGNDTLNGGGGADDLNGGDGNDIVTGGGGADIMDGGDGIDTVSYSNSAQAVAVNLGPAIFGSGGDAEGDILVRIENLQGSNQADALTGAAGDNVLEGRSGADQLNGGTDSDTASYAGSNAAVTVKLFDGTATGGHAQGDTFAAIENLLGSNFGDTLAGNGQANVLDGGRGNDSLTGGNGDDTLIAGDGDDALAGGGGSDTYKASALDVGNDIVNDSGGDADRLDLAGINLGIVPNILGIVSRQGDDLIFTLDSDSIVTVKNHFIAANQIESVAIGGFKLVLASGTIGGGSSGIIVGTEGDDFVNGYAGDDFLEGAGGDDRIVGGSGDDVIDGGDGLDVVSGGSDADTFKFGSDGAIDRITDFAVGEDTIAFDRAAFGLAAGTDIADLVHIGGFPIGPDPAFYVDADGVIFFLADGAGFGGAIETVGRVGGDLAGLSADDFALA